MLRWIGAAAFYGFFLVLWGVLGVVPSYIMLGLLGAFILYGFVHDHIQNKARDG